MGKRVADRPLQTGVVMDPVGGINIKKDSTFAMMLESQRRGHTLQYMEPGDLGVENGVAVASMRQIEVMDDPADWYRLGEPVKQPLGSLDIVLMRRDPPFDRAGVTDCWRDAGSRERTPYA